MSQITFSAGVMLRNSGIHSIHAEYEAGHGTKQKKKKKENMHLTYCRRVHELIELKFPKPKINCITFVTCIYGLQIFVFKWL